MTGPNNTPGENYCTTGGLRTETPRIETPFGTMAYSRHISFKEYGQIELGYFETPYDGTPSNKETTIEVNRVPYSGTIYVYLRRDGSMALEFRHLHPRGSYIATPSEAAERKLEKFFLPLAAELFPIPTRAHMEHAIYTSISRELYSGASSTIHKTSSDVYRDARYSGYADVIRAGALDGLRRAMDAATSEHWNNENDGR